LKFYRRGNRNGFSRRYFFGFDFYEEAKKCYAIIATGESALYANLILQKGVI
jgi:L-fucose mutarotase